MVPGTPGPPCWPAAPLPRPPPAPQYDSRARAKGLGRISFTTEWVAGAAPKRRVSVGAPTVSYPKPGGSLAAPPSPPAAATFSYPK